MLGAEYWIRNTVILAVCSKWLAINNSPVSTHSKTKIFLSTLGLLNHFKCPAEGTAYLDMSTLKPDLAVPNIGL
jgi:hypothetical protein